MSFLAPIWLFAAGAVAVGVLVAHLFAITVPPQDVYPTAGFIPVGTPRTVVRSRRFSDVWLLLLRLLAVALLGLALSGAHMSRKAPAQVILIDRSRAVVSIPSITQAMAAGSEIIVFDSVARRVPVESLETLQRVNVRGSLSTAIVAAHRLIAQSGDVAPRTALHIASPLVREEMDSATTRLLAMWRGEKQMLRVSASSTPAAPLVEIRAEGDDPIAAILGGNARAAGSNGANLVSRIIRGVPTRADSQLAERGGALVIWPAQNEQSVLALRATPDSQGAIATSTHAVVARFARQFDPHPGRTLVRWVDGQPAATERALGAGCIRDVAIPVDPVGDIALRESFRGITATLLESCGGRPDFSQDSLDLPGTAGSSPSARNDSRGVSDVIPSEARGLQLWLALAALGALIAEQFLRAKRRSAA